MQNVDKRNSVSNRWIYMKFSPNTSLFPAFLFNSKGEEEKNPHKKASNVKMSHKNTRISCV